MINYWIPFQEGRKWVVIYVDKGFAIRSSHADKFDTLRECRAYCEELAQEEEQRDGLRKVR